jgi:hypothetical protein
MRVTRFLIVFCALFCTSAMTAGCARQSMIGVPMSAAPAYGIDNVVYGSGYGSGGYGGVAAPCPMAWPPLPLTRPRRLTPQSRAAP